MPVIKNCEAKSTKEISRELTTLANKAHKDKLEMDDIDGGTITISSLGGIGGTYFTPIVLTNQAAILGFSKAEYKIICKNDKFIKEFIEIRNDYNEIIKSIETEEYDKKYKKVFDKKKKRTEISQAGFLYN